MSNCTSPQPDVPDGKSYVAAAADASARSRNFLYFIFILVLLTASSIRNQYTPDWMEKRAANLQNLYLCLKADAQNKKAACKEFEDKAKKAGYGSISEAADKLLTHNYTGEIGESDFLAKNSITFDEMKLRIESYLKKDIEEYTIQIPLWGSSIDINDLWILSAFGMSFLLYLYRASLEGEYRIITYIRDTRPQFAELVTMSQVLSILSIGEGAFYRYLEKFLYLLPTWLNCYLLWQDLQTYKISVMDVAWTQTLVEYGLEIVMVATVVFLNFKCLGSQKKVREAVEQLVALGQRA